MDGHTKIWTPMLDVVDSHVLYVVAHAQDNGGPSRISGRVLWASTMLRCGLPRSVVDDHSKPSWAPTSGNLDDHHALEWATTSGHEFVLGGHTIRSGEPRNRLLGIHEAFGRPRCVVGVQVSHCGRPVCCVSLHVFVWVATNCVWAGVDAHEVLWAHVEARNCVRGRMWAPTCKGKTNPPPQRGEGCDGWRLSLRLMRLVWLFSLTFSA